MADHHWPDSKSSIRRYRKDLIAAPYCRASLPKKMVSFVSDAGAFKKKVWGNKQHQAEGSAPNAEIPEMSGGRLGVI